MRDVTETRKVIVHQGDTVEEGHPLLLLSPDSFEPLAAKHPAPAQASKPARRLPRLG